MDAADPSPLDAALAQLGALAAAGASPARMAQAVGEVVAGWAAEPDMDALTARLRVEHLWDSLGRDAAGLEEQVNNADGADRPALAGAKRSLAALQAAVAALAAAHERL